MIAGAVTGHRCCCGISRTPYFHRSRYMPASSLLETPDVLSCLAPVPPRDTGVLVATDAFAIRLSPAEDDDDDEDEEDEDEDDDDDLDEDAVDEDDEDDEDEDEDDED